MAASSRASQSSKSSQQTYVPSPNNNNTSLLLEKARQGDRRSTPDSEALASSEDEVDQHQYNQAQAQPFAKPARRTSWLNEIPSSMPRKPSFTTTSFSPVNSNPTTPAADQPAWGATATSPGITGSFNWASSGNGSFPWGTGIWNAESRKEPPSRLSEVLHSPTSVHPPNFGFSGADDVISPTARSSTEASVPFAIPVHPTPKAYRSQSYSVGQLDPESTHITPPKAVPPMSATRSRNSAQYSVQRRSSRPSLLGELGRDSAVLGRVREDEDDDVSPNDSEGNATWSSSQARTIEQLALENALLRQAASSQLEIARFRDRTLSSASANSGYSFAQGHKLHPIHGSVPEETDQAVEDLDELGGFAGYNNSLNNARRRFSLHSANVEKQYPTFSPLENRTLENIKRAQWQSSLGFGSISELPQSRRHSFADVPTRNVSSFPGAAENQPPVGTAFKKDEGTGNYLDTGSNMSQADNREYMNSRNNQSLTERAKELETLRARQFAASYFSGHDVSDRSGEPAPSTGISTALHQAYVMPNAYGRQHAALAQPHQNQQLFVVTFKCCRADVFYIQEDTGLQVKPGDLVIVEADRGTDLGTVAHANISWQNARELKEQYAEDHYKWLMLFSRQSQSGTPHAVNPNGATPMAGSAVGGMGPQGQHTGQEVQGGDIKPKLIKRLAQHHEIQTLRDKEGNEAKAKRVCQQKVVEHRLNMEILDAEFQMDWKKLTFYYFADTYINFNSLVTDLFKIYKTRIWMSAINPASFVTPTAGLQIPGTLTSSSLGYDLHADRRRQHDYKKFGTGINQGLSPGIFSEPLNREVAGQTMPVHSPYLDQYQSMVNAARPDSGYVGYTPGMQPQTDPFTTYPSSYGVPDPAAGPGFAATGIRRGHPGQDEWSTRFQGLSLGS
ncbi:hypothetical protein LOZ66_006070 [Ophidiomyces ophidiicola]|nr:hypothetical protein LOZ66_006070 [Ophidiomyces ophidiicola]